MQPCGVCLRYFKLRIQLDKITLKYQRYTSSGCKDLEIIKFRFAKRLSKVATYRNEQIIHDVIHKCQIKQGKRNFLTLVDMFSVIILKRVKTSHKEHIKLHLFHD